MNRGTEKQTMWGIGLNDEDSALIDSVGGKDFELVRIPAGHIPDPDRMDDEQPCIIWISRNAWDEIQAKPEKMVQHLDLIPRVLILGGDYTLEELEEALDGGFADVIKPPLTESRVRDVLHRAIETQGLYNDIVRMTREIVLERELLERKNDILSFIVSFTTRTTESLDPLDILANAQEDLAALLPVRAINAACWKPAGSALEANLFLTSHEQDIDHGKWVDLMLGSAEKLSGLPVAGYQISYFAPSDTENELIPEPGKVILLPLKAGGEAIGSIALLAETELNLGRDQVQILNSAMQHLGLALRNAMLFCEMKQHADYDGLTHIHNRRHFEGRIREELNRHKRYDMPMTVMMLDIDHFKKINDTYGHQTGDAVLRELAGILRDTVRNTDYVARYGGEEFVVILPHTSGDQAEILAERLREQIAAKPFKHENKSIRATISVGLAHLEPSALKDTEELVFEADQALYFAKANGRNIVCSFNQCTKNAMNG